MRTRSRSSFSRRRSSSPRERTGASCRSRTCQARSCAGDPAVETNATTVVAPCHVNSFRGALQRALSLAVGDGDPLPDAARAGAPRAAALLALRSGAGVNLGQPHVIAAAGIDGEGGRVAHGFGKTRSADDRLEEVRRGQAHVDVADPAASELFGRRDPLPDAAVGASGAAVLPARGHVRRVGRRTLQSQVVCEHSGVRGGSWKRSGSERDVPLPLVLIGKTAAVQFVSRAPPEIDAS